MITMPEISGGYSKPTLFFTLSCHPISEAVIKKNVDVAQCSLDLRIFSSEDEMQRYFEENPKSLSTAVALYDCKHWLNGKHFCASSREIRKPYEIPLWAQKSQWIVMIGTQINCDSRQRSCAHQIFADFGKNFEDRIRDRQFPWEEKPKSKKKRRKSPRRKKHSSCL